MKRREFLIVASTLLALILVISFIGACAKPAATPAPGAPTITVTAPAKTTTVTVTASAPTATPAKTFELVYQASYPKTSSFVYAFGPEFLGKIEQRSNGRIKFKRFDSAELVSTDKQLVACAQGTLDMFLGTGPYFASAVPEGDFDMALFGYPSQASTALFFALPEVQQLFRDAYAKVGVYHLGGGIAHSGHMIMTKFPVLKFEDLKGKKMRAGGGLATDGLAALGCSVVVIATPEIYTALQRGTVDGCTLPEYYMYDSKLYEVCNYIMLPSHMPCAPNRIWVNPQKWAALGTELQRVIEDTFTEVALLWWPVYCLQSDELVRDLIKSKGVTYTNLAPEDVAKMKAAVEPLRAGWAKRSPGCARLNELLKAWEKKDRKAWTLS